MSRAAKRKAAPKPAGAFPDPSADWMPSDFRDRHGPWIRGLAEVDADSADRSGPDKAFRKVRPLAWQLFLVGGSIHGIRGRLDVARQHKTQITATIAALERQGRDASEARHGLGSADQNIATLEALVAAAEGWDGPDNVILKQRLEQAGADHRTLASRIAPYRNARLPYPTEWDRELHESEKRLAAADAAFDAARDRLDDLGKQLREVTESAYQALAGCLGHVEDRLGQACARIVHQNDPAFLASFPARAPDDLIPIFNRAVRVNEIANALGARRDAALARFWLAAGEVARPIIVGKLGLRPPLPEETTGRRGFSADIMGAIL